MAIEVEVAFMALSENEQRILDELEKQLFDEDPSLASQFGQQRSSALNTKRLATGGIIIVVGLALLVFAVSIPAIWLGVLAFIVMVAGAAYALKSDKLEQIPVDDPRRQHPSFARGDTGAKGQGFMKKMEERWDRRSDEA